MTHLCDVSTHGLQELKKNGASIKHLKHEIQVLKNDLMLKFMKASIDGTKIPLLFEYEYYSEYCATVQTQEL